MDSVIQPLNNQGQVIDKVYENLQLCMCVRTLLGTVSGTFP